MLFRSIHIKNKLVDFKPVLPIALPAVAAGIAASYLSKLTGARALSRYFGLFLTLLGIYQLITAIINAVKEHKKRKRQLLNVREPKRSEIFGSLD